MSLKAVKTEDGVEIRHDGEAIAGPANTEPIRGDALSTLLLEAGFSEMQVHVIKIALGDVEYADERGQD